MDIDTKRVEACIDSVMAKHPRTTPAALATYYEAMHQELAPLARDLERQLNALTTERDALAAQVEALKALLPDASVPGEPHPNSIYGGEPTGSRP